MYFQYTADVWHNRSSYAAYKDNETPNHIATTKSVDCTHLHQCIDAVSDSQGTVVAIPKSSLMRRKQKTEDSARLKCGSNNERCACCIEICRTHANLPGTLYILLTDSA